MFELACLSLALAWLYFWLSGHWFARVIAFLAILGAAGVAGFVAFMVMPSKPGPWDVVSEEPASSTQPDGPWNKYRAGEHKPVIATDGKGNYLTLNGDGEWKPLPPGFVPPKLNEDGAKPHAPEPARAPRWMEYGGLALAGLLALLSWPLASIPIAYHRRARSRQTTMASRVK
jgi:hypothetical protein